jgi:hypothetical protein
MNNLKNLDQLEYNKRNKQILDTGNPTSSQVF